MQYISLIVGWLWITSFLYAQSKVPPDSLSLPAGQQSSTVSENRTLPAFDGRSDTLSTWRYDPEELGHLFYEDFAELFDNLPFTRTGRTGDVGYPVFLSLMGMPPRFLRLTVDGLVWPPGFYGQTNLTAIPQTVADAVAIHPVGGRLAFWSRPAFTRTTWTYLEYVDGPFGSDAVRLRFRRPLRKTLQTYWSAVFSNADGQPIATPNTKLQTKYEGFRIYGLLEKRLRPNSPFYLRYRFLKSVGEVTTAVPLFPEQFPYLINGKYKESHLAHFLELRRASPPPGSGDSAETPADWKIRVYFWEQREEYRDDTRGLLIQHRRARWALEGQKRWATARYRAGLTARAEYQTIRRTTIDAPVIADFQLQADAAWIPTERFHANARFLWQNRTSYTNQIHGQAGWSWRLSSWLIWAAGADWRVAVPEPGEYANTVPGVLLSNPRLQPMQMAALRSGFRLQKQKWRGAVYVAHYLIRRAFRLQPVEDLFQITNAGGRTAYPAVEGFFWWRPFRALVLKGWYSGRIQNPDAPFLFAPVPRQMLRAEMETSRDFFQHDLLVDFLLRISFYGDRPVLEQYDNPSLYTRLPGFWKIDGILKLHFKDAIIFLNYENITNQRADWRLYQPIRGRTFRLGVNWIFWE